MKKWVSCIMLLLLVTSGCVAIKRRPIAVEPCGQLAVSLRAYREDVGRAWFPESSYTRNFEYIMTSDEADLEDPNWWENLHASLERHYNDEGEGDFWKYLIFEVPPVEWLQENVVPGIDTRYLVTFELPSGGIILEAVDSDLYQRYAEKYPHEEHPTHLVLNDGTDIYLLWRIFESLRNDGVYPEFLRNIQRVESGLIGFKYPEGNTFALLRLPDDLMEMSEDELKVGHPYEEVIMAEMYCRD